MKTKGFTLIEMMVVVAIIATLLALSIPSLDTWIANTKIRSTAEAFQNGLRRAQQLAAQRNGIVQFKLISETTRFGAGKNAFCDQIAASTDPSSSNTSKGAFYWAICVPDEADEKRGNETKSAAEKLSGDLPIFQQVRELEDSIVKINTEHAPKSKNGGAIEFRGTGGTNTNAIEVFSFERNNPDNNRLKCTKDGGEVRCLKVVLYPGGKVRMCDPGYDGEEKSNGQAGPLNAMACNF